MTAKLSHPNVACFIGILERPNRVDIVTNFYHVNGNQLNLCDIPAENADVRWPHLLKGLCGGIRYLHDKLKILHNDIKSNNVVLEGSSMSEAEAVLIDFGKATYQICPKVYETPADTSKFRHLAPELGQSQGKQTAKSDIYSLGYMIRSFKLQAPEVPFVVCPNVSILLTLDAIT